MEKVLLVILALVVALAAVFGGIALINERNFDDMAEYIDTFSAQRVDPTLHPEKDEHGNWYFTADEDFKVLHLTDVHFTGGFLNAEQDKKAINAVAAMVYAEKPDLVIVTGDIAFAIPSTGTINNSYAHKMFIRLMENLGVYWTVTFGNHDDESFNYYRREAVGRMYADDSLERCLYMNSPEGISGVGNHVINVKGSDGEVNKSLIMLDTHSYVHTDLLGGTVDALFWNYDAIKQDQVVWYEDIIEQYAPKSSLLFFHIPIGAVKQGYDEYVLADRTDTDNAKWLFGVDGEDREAEVVYSSRLDDGSLFNKILELGNTKGAFFGHDHCNNFTLDYKGVIFSYGYSIDYSAYDGDLESLGLQRGCTTLTLSPDGELSPEDIVKENYYSDKYVPLYEKEEVEMKPLYNN